jgi:Fe-Mn family superoxide dismutase
MSINGSGWVWLIVGPNSQLKVLASYNAGSPFDLPSRQTVDPNTGWNLDTTGRFGSQQKLSQLRANRKHEYLVLPILGLNCWEHAYVPDYGVSIEGKQQYLKNWWSAINWKRVFDAQARRTLQRRAIPMQ